MIRYCDPSGYATGVNLRASHLLTSSILAAAVCAFGSASPPSWGLAGLAWAQPAFDIEVDKQNLDLEAHRLQFKCSRSVHRVEMKVFGESGAVLANVSEEFEASRPNTPLSVRWRPSSDEPVLKIELFVYDPDGAYKGVRLIPWSLHIPHEEVEFATNSAEIRSSEEGKLQASLELIKSSLKKHEDLGPIGLYVAGHTDTRGSPAHNQELSRRRARSIAQWFRAHGLKILIAYHGFGEGSLKVPTADEVDEPKNRRVDYVLSVEAPVFKSSGTGANWSRL